MGVCGGQPDREHVRGQIYWKFKRLAKPTALRACGLLDWPDCWVALDLAVLSLRVCAELCCQQILLLWSCIHNWFSLLLLHCPPKTLRDKAINTQLQHLTPTLFPLPAADSPQACNYIFSFKWVKHRHTGQHTHQWCCHCKCWCPEWCSGSGYNNSFQLAVARNLLFIYAVKVSF